MNQQELFTIGEYEALKCALCGGDLYLDRGYSIPLYAESVAANEVGPEHAVTNSWRVMCSESDHVLATSAEIENAEPFALDALTIGYVYKDPDGDG